MATSAFQQASVIHVHESRAAAPVDVRAWGLVVDPQRALFGYGHLAVAIVALLQCAVVTIALKRCLPGNVVSEVRRRVVDYCLATACFSAVYAFTAHTWASNLLAVWHNHTEVLLIAIALLPPASWRRVRNFSLLYSALYFAATLVITVKNARRAWTMVGIVWDGMLPLAFTLRYFRSGRAAVWLPGIWGSLFHLISIVTLLTMVDGFAQWFSVLLPPTFVSLAWFAFRWERRRVSQLPGLRGLTVGPPPQAPTFDSRRRTRAKGGQPTGQQAPGGANTKAWRHGALPDSAFVCLWLAVVVFVGLPMAGVLYGPRIVATVMHAIAPLLPPGAVAGTAGTAAS